LLTNYLITYYRTERELSLNDIRFFISIHIALIMSGLWTTIFGSILIEMSSSFNLTIDKMGTVFPLVSVGFLIGIAINIILGNKINIKKILNIFFVIFSISYLIIFLSKFIYLTFLSAVIVGVCSGFIQVVLIVLVSNLVKKNKGFYINLSYFFVSVGCLVGVVVGPYIVKLGLSWNYTFLAVSIILFINCILFLKVRVPSYEDSYKDQLEMNLSGTRKIKIIIISIVALSFFVLTPIYVGISSWVPTFLRLNKNISIGLSANILAIFWASLAVGRFFFGYITKKINIFVLSIFLSFIFVLTFASILYVTSNKSMIYFALSGFFIASLYPNLITISSEYFQTRKKIVVSTLVLIGMFGTTVFNIVFVYFARTKGLDSIIYLLIIIGVVLLIFFISIFILHKINIKISTNLCAKSK